MKPVHLASALLLFLTVIEEVPRTVSAADASLYLVEKGFEFTQTDSNLPTINATNGFGFNAEVAMSVNNSVTNATVQPQGGVAQVLVPSAAQNKLDYKHKYNTLLALNAHYPDGAYIVSIFGRNDGFHQPTLQLTGSAYPTGPHIANFPNLQAVNANGYFQVHWDPFSGGTSSDYLQFRIEDLNNNKIFETPDLGKAGALDGTPTKILVAPGTLIPNQTYRTRVLFRKVTSFNTVSYPGAVGEAAYYARTTFFLVSSAATAPDVKTFEISKSTKWIQTNSTSIGHQVGQEFGFDATLKANNTNLVSNATVLLPPTNSVRDLQLLPGGTTFDYSDTAATQGQLDAGYGTGTYALSFSTVHDGNKSLSLSLPADNFPTPPRFANFEQLQTVNINHAFTISWNPWVGGGPNDFIHVRIEDVQHNKFWETGDPGKAGSLDGRATSAVVPAGVVPPSGVFEIHLTFIHPVSVDTTSYPGVLGLADFQTRTKITMQTVGADVTGYSVFKEQVSRQTDSGPASILVSNGFRFEARAQGAFSNSVAGASVSTPLGSTPALVRQSDGQQFTFSSSYGTKSALDGAYPNGTYAMQINAVSDGLKNLPLATGPDGYPNAPHFTDYYSAQLVAPARDFILTWDPFSSGAGSDSIQLIVYDSALNAKFQTPSLGEVGALSGLATSAVIPASTLSSNTVYTALLFFRKITATDTGSYPGAQGFAGFTSATEVRLVTTGLLNPPQLTLARSATNSAFQISAEVVSGLTYRLDGSSNLVQWIPISTNTAYSNPLHWIDPLRGPIFFYRTIVLP
jgi:hypothetical protein